MDQTGDDPERLLASYEWRFDPDTLREVLDEADTALFRRVHAELAARSATARDDADRARLLSLRAVVGRSLMYLDEALADGRRALAHAEATGNARLIAGVRVRLAHVYQWRREFDPADRLFAAALAADPPGPALASTHQHAGKCAYDQGRYIEACRHFERALELRRDGDPELLASTELAIAGVFRRVAAHGWGPSPRPLDELSGPRTAPVPTRDDHDGRWGAVDASGRVVVPFEYTGFATVLHDGAHVDGFSEGGFAVVERDGRYGVVDRDGRIVVPPVHAAIAVHPVALLYSDGQRWGALDRRGRPLLAPTHRSRAGVAGEVDRRLGELAVL